MAHEDRGGNGLQIDAQADPATTREQRRSRRKRDVRGRTISVKRITKGELAMGRLMYPEDEHADVQRPRTRGDCAEGVRPCPFVSCVHHLYLDVVARTGAIKLNFPDLEPDELTETCVLDVAERDGTTLEGVAEIMNLTRERIRQLEVIGLAKLEATIQARDLKDLVGEGERLPPTKRRLPIAGQRVVEPSFDVDHFASEELDAE